MIGIRKEPVKPVIQISLIAALFLLCCDLHISAPEVKGPPDSLFEYLSGKAVLEILKNGNDFWFVSVTKSDSIPDPFTSDSLYDMQLSWWRDAGFDYCDLSLLHIGRLTADHHGRIYAACGSRIVRVQDPHTLTDFLIHTEPVSALAFDADEHVWIGGYNQGLCVRGDDDVVCFNTSDSMLPTNEIHDIVIDRSHVVWVALGVDYNGLLRMDGENRTFFRCSDLTGDRYHYFADLLLDKEDHLWVAWQSGCLTTTDGSDWIFSKPGIPGDCSKNILGLVTSDADGNILAVYMDRYLPQDDILSDIYCRSGDAWIRLAENVRGRIYDIELDNNRRLWIGTNRGICTLDISG